MNNRLTPISELFVVNRSGQDPVVRGKNGFVNWSTFRTDTSNLIDHFQKQQIKKVLVYCDDCYSFAVSVCATWFSGAVAILPPNAQIETLNDIIEGVDCFVTDLTFSHLKIAIINPLSVKHQEKETIWQKPKREQLCLELYTSGSLGNRKVVPKKIKHLEEELITLESTWGNQILKSEIISTVSHQHIYGFLFKFLWPLCSGRIFHKNTFFYPENLLPEMDSIKNCCLISSPAHLKRMPELINIKALASLTNTIFSSGGPLNYQTSELFADQCGITPIEILGSTETGGVAWKAHQKGQKPYWEPLSGIDIKVDEKNSLYVKSKVVSVNSSNDWFKMGDQAELGPDNKFILKGRGDRIVKIEEKRLSLNEMENVLKKHADVIEAKVFTLEHNSKDNKRIPLAAVIILKSSVKSEKEKKTIFQVLKTHLSRHFDRVLLPRFWRIVDKFPEDAQGKVTLPVLQPLFIKNDKTDVTYPEILEEIIEKHRNYRKLKVPADLFCLKDHFPKSPIVPGFIQINWIMEIISKMQGQMDLSFKALEVLKFHEILQPDVVFYCEVRFDVKSEKFIFKTWNDEKKFCSGRALVHSPSSKKQ